MDLGSSRFAHHSPGQADGHLSARSWGMDFPPASVSLALAAPLGSLYWPMGLAWLLASMATLLRYAMGEGVVALVGSHPNLVGSVLPVAVLMPHDVSLRVGLATRRRIGDGRGARDRAHAAQRPHPPAHG